MGIGVIQKNVEALQQTLRGVSKLREDMLKYKAPVSKITQVFGAPAIFIQESTTPTEKAKAQQVAKTGFAAGTRAIFQKYKEDLPKTQVKQQVETFARTGRPAPAEVITEYRDVLTEETVREYYTTTELQRERIKDIIIKEKEIERGGTITLPDIDILGGLDELGKYALIIGGLIAGAVILTRGKK